MHIGAFTKSYGSRLVLDFPGCTFEQGKIYGVIGANGCGKSTLAKVLSGVEPADSGSKLTIDPISVIGYLPQKPYAFQMSVLKNTLLGGGNFKEAESILTALGLMSLMQKSAKRLSGGECARMALARTLLRKVDLLILDEPCASMDIHACMLAEDAILQYKAQHNAAILLITHSIKQAARVSNDILFLADGRVIENGAADSILHAPQYDQTKQFLEFYSL